MRVRRSTWPDSSRNAGTRRWRCTSLALSRPTPTPQMSRRPQPTTTRPWPWPTKLGMRPIEAHCHRGLGMLYAMVGQQEQARAALSTAIEMYRDMGMIFWLPETEAALAQVEGR